MINLTCFADGREKVREMADLGILSVCLHLKLKYFYTFIWGSNVGIGLVTEL